MRVDGRLDSSWGYAARHLGAGDVLLGAMAWLLGRVDELKAEGGMVTMGTRTERRGWCFTAAVQNAGEVVAAKQKVGE
jgi:hypothetical protein